MGYLTEAIEMRGRSRRHQASWQPHLESSRDFILSVVEKCRNRNAVVVLGSGLLLDVPLAELASMFGRVILMDVVCLPEIRRMIKTYRNAAFVEILKEGVEGKREAVACGAGAQAEAVGAFFDFVFAARRARRFSAFCGAAGDVILEDGAGGGS